MAFDYVIVGGGSAGCVLAARLSENPALSVCLIEAGGEGRDFTVTIPAGFVLRGKANGYGFKTVPQPGLDGRQGFQPRGKCLGGSSAVNAMLYVRGQHEDHDAWGEGWSWDDCLPWPRIDPNFLSHPDDVALTVRGAQLMRRILNAPPLKAHIAAPLYPLADDSDEEMLKAIRARADTIYHPVGTCKMGGDDRAVVDRHLRVHGLQNLRVVDASIMPTLISGNTNAPTIMIAERATGWILAESGR